MTAEQLLLDWAAELPAWSQDALRRGCQTGEITAEDLSALYAMALTTHGLTAQESNAATPIPLAAAHLSTALSTTESYLVTGLKDIQHVNALAPGQSLTIGPKGMTVIFGSNGSGKSGYSRLFKSACRAADDETIHRNIFAKSQGEQSAVFTVAAVGSPDAIITVPWTPKAKPEQLATLAFYDVRCARVLIDKDKEIAYSPILLRGVDALGNAVGNIVNRLSQEADLARQLPAVLTPLTIHPGTPVAKALSSLGPETTSLTNLLALRGLSESQQQTLTQALTDRQRLDAEDPGKVAVSEDRFATSHWNRLDQAGQLAEAVSAESLTLFESLLADQRATAKAAREVLEVSLGVSPLKGIGSDPWRNLYNAARTYSIYFAYPKQDFPVTNEEARCVLCQQPLTKEGRDRLRAFDAAKE